MLNAMTPAFQVAGGYIVRQAPVVAIKLGQVVTFIGTSTVMYVVGKTTMEGVTKVTGYATDLVERKLADFASKREAAAANAREQTADFDAALNREINRRIDNGELVRPAPAATKPTKHEPRATPASAPTEPVPA